MTDYTQAQLATRVLKDLGLVGADETPTAEDMDWVTETVASEVLMLSALGLPIYNGSEITIPQEYLTVLSRRIGLSVAPSFGLMSMNDAQLAMREAERNLTMLSTQNTYPTLLKSNDSTGNRSSFNFTTGQ